MANHKLIGEILCDLGKINRADLQIALKEHAETGNKLDQILLDNKLITEEQLIEVLEITLGIPHVNLSKTNIDVDTINIIPAHLIRLHNILPIAKRDNTITLAMANPLNHRAIEDVRMASSLDVIPVIAGATELDNAIRQYLAFRVDPTVKKILGELRPEINLSLSNQNIKDFKIDDAPMVRMVNSLIVQAVQGRCSDIHIEPQELETRVRFRVDGELFVVLTIPKQSTPALISRLKIMAGMDIAEKRVAQDGRFNMLVEDRYVDFRVSTLPTSFGEKVVMRILDRVHAITSINKLGLSNKNREQLLSLSHRPYGLVLIAGPTSSGKTTTLYSVLNEINFVTRNSLTIEDPIEYSIAGINQVQVNPKAGLNFANGLRAILRQDPDVIMVGEIRDLETAQLAVQAALTGHLVLSTLHTNGAAATIARLVNMGVESFLLRSALAGVVYQKLVRRLCISCRETYSLDEETAHKLGIPEESGQEFYQSLGCNNCRQLGYQGRIALHETLYLDQELKNLIGLNDYSEDTISRLAIKSGMITIKKDGIEKAKQGLTSLEEVMKAVLLGE
ncbi:MAG TPA: ATPase, T2SS/T4P/T4SS family [Syntrophomonadaceae bacterium]|nr:ATPase, T2SS/T4P/T4SS family [Syntrophomonadaceae bacterium]